MNFGVLPCPQPELFYKAATNAISTLTFILPEVTIPMFLELVHSGLEAKQMIGIGPLEVGIWKTPEGQLFVDGRLRWISTSILMFWN